MKNESHILEFPTGRLTRMDAVPITQVTNKDLSLRVRVLYD